jgi:hypothetical protein
MTKRIVRLALVLGTAATLSGLAPAQAGEAPCAGTFVVQCVKDTIGRSVSQICVDVGTFPYCVPPLSS